MKRLIQSRFKICEEKNIIRGQVIFFQRRHTDGQQIYEKVPIITNHEGNINPSDNEMSPQTC